VKVLIGCEFSGIVREAFKNRGHDAWSCDLLDTEIPGQHIKDNVLNHLNDGWDLAIFHPPCTYLTNAGVRHLHGNVASKNGIKAKVHGTARFLMMYDACYFFNQLKHAPINKIAIENPIPHKYAVGNGGIHQSNTVIGKYDQLIRPWMFGNPENKAICLWLKNLPKLQPTKIIPKVDRIHAVHMCPPGPDRWKIRSRFFKEVAEVMALTWG